MLRQLACAARMKALKLKCLDLSAGRVGCSLDHNAASRSVSLQAPKLLPPRHPRLYCHVCSADATVFASPALQRCLQNSILRSFKRSRSYTKPGLRLLFRKSLFHSRRADCLLPTEAQLRHLRCRPLKRSEINALRLGLCNSSTEVRGRIPGLWLPDAEVLFEAFCTISPSGLAPKPLPKLRDRQSDNSH